MTQFKTKYNICFWKTWIMQSITCLLFLKKSTVSYQSSHWLGWWPSLWLMLGDHAGGTRLDGQLQRGVYSYPQGSSVPPKCNHPPLLHCVLHKGILYWWLTESKGKKFVLNNIGQERDRERQRESKKYSMVYTCTQYI